MRASLPRFARALLLMFGSLVFSALTPACIPSHRMVHDGDVYFERCYGADYDARYPAGQKEACWQAWLAHYTKHQPAHRVDYALRRIEALQNGEPAPELPGLGNGGLTQGQLVAEVQDIDAGVSNNGSALLAPRTEVADGGGIPNGCLHYCDEYEAACSSRCQGTSPACFSGCERERAICLHACH
jgi:hypothetical protein